MLLKEKVIVLTGASGGIGQTIVKKFVAEGAKVLAVDLDEAGVQKVADEYNGEVSALGVDVTSYDQVAAMMDTAVERFGTLDVVHNNAGINIPKMLLDHDPAKDWDLITAVNQKGVYFGILAGARKLIELGKPGVILNTSSIYGTGTAALTFTYNCSKASVDMMTKSAALELGPHGIRVVGIAPGRVDTPMLQEGKKLGIWEHMCQEQMRGTITQPEEIAAVCAFLASDESNCINGSTVAAEDGYLSFKFPFPSPQGG